MSTAYLQIEQTRELGIFGLLGKERISIFALFSAILLAALAWLGSLAFLAPFRPNEVWALISWIGSSQQVYFACVGASILWVIAALILRKRATAALAAAVTAYLSAFWASGLLYALYDPDQNFPFTHSGDGVDFAIARLWLGVPALILLGACALLFRSSSHEPRPHLGFGNWFLKARETSAKENMQPYWRRLVIGFVIVAIAIFLILQSLVQFTPITSGKLLPLLPAIALAALTNSIVEEMIYRGFLQPAFMRVAGVGAGLWIASIFFGLCHWGLSFGVLASFPVSLMIGLGSVVWGKAAFETRGIAWPIAAHFLIDVGIMSAYFV